MPYIKFATGLFLVVVLSLAGCRKDPEVPSMPGTEAGMQPLKLTVKPLWNGAPFDKHVIYAAAGNQRIQVNELKFYLAPLRLIGEDGDADLFEADLFHVVNGPVTRILSVPVGSYQSVGLGLGLPYALNHRDLATIPPNAPTGNNSGMYWSWSTQYRFVIFSGRFDSDPAGTGEPPFVFDLHTGLDACYRTRTIPCALEVNGTDTARLTVSVDIARFFTDGTTVLDLSQGAVWHGSDNLPLGMQVADLQVAAFGVESE